MPQLLGRKIKLGHYPKLQRDEMRKAFYAGASATFFGILKMLEPGEDATENDLRKMDELNRELTAFAKAV